MCGELWNRNSPTAVFEWAVDALEASDIPEEDRQKLKDAALTCVVKGGWRGDVCDKWRNMGYGPDKIKDFYP